MFLKSCIDIIDCQFRKNTSSIFKFFSEDVSSCFHFYNSLVLLFSPNRRWCKQNVEFLFEWLFNYRFTASETFVYMETLP